MWCRLLSVICFSCLISSSIYAQEIRVIDNKGTLQDVTVNKVSTSNTAPSNPVEGDVWFDTSTNISKIYDGSIWKTIDEDKVSTSTTVPTTPVEGDVWFDSVNDSIKIYDGSDWKILSSIEVDGDTTNEIQGIDTLALQGDTLLQISLEGDEEPVKTIDLSVLNSNDWKVDGNLGTTAGSNFIGTTDAQDLVFKTNNQERLRIKEGDSARVLLANPGDFAFPGLSSSAVIGIDGTNHSRLRITAGDDETYNDSKGASIDLHGNSSSANTGVLDLVAGSSADSSKAAIKFWTNTDGSTQQTSAVITGEGNMGIGNSTPNTNAILDLTNSSDKAFLLPTETLPTNINSPTDGMLVYSSDNDNAYLRADSAWKPIAYNAVTNELIFDGDDDANTSNDDYYYVSMEINGDWKVIRYNKTDVNDEDEATVTNNSGQTTQPTDLATCTGLTFN